MTMQTIIKVSLWFKVFLILIFCSWLILAGWLALKDIPGKSWGYYTIPSAVVLLMFFAGKRAFELGTVVLTGNGVEHKKLFCEGRLFIRRQLLWSEIVKVFCKPGAYLLVGPSFSIEVNAIVFNNSSNAIEFIQENCPMARFSAPSAPPAAHKEK